MNIHDHQIDELIDRGYNPALVIDNILELLTWIENDMNCDGYSNQQEAEDFLMEMRDEDFTNGD